MLLKVNSFSGSWWSLMHNAHPPTSIYGMCTSCGDLYATTCRGHRGVRGICIHVSTQIRKNGVLTTLHI